MIDCRGCGNRHTGAGGSKFLLSHTHAKVQDKMSFLDKAPSRDSPEYRSYLESRMEEQEKKLRIAEEQSRIHSLERQLADLQLRTSYLKEKEGEDDTQEVGATGFGSRVLSGRAGIDSSVHTPVDPQRSKTEKEVICKLSPSSYLPEPKTMDKTTYQEFMLGMTKVLQFIIEVGGAPNGYAAHMSFIASEASLNLYYTDSLMKYEKAVTDKVISGLLNDWVSADPESVAIHLGVDAT